MTITSAISELEKKFKDLVFTNKAEIDLHGQNETGLFDVITESGTSRCRKPIGLVKLVILYGCSS